MFGEFNSPLGLRKQWISRMAMLRRAKTCPKLVDSKDLWVCGKFFVGVTTLRQKFRGEWMAFRQGCGLVSTKFESRANTQVDPPIYGLVLAIVAKQVVRDHRNRRGESNPKPATTASAKIERKKTRISSRKLGWSPKNERRRPWTDFRDPTRCGNRTHNLHNKKWARNGPLLAPSRDVSRTVDLLSKLGNQKGGEANWKTALLRGRSRKLSKVE